MPVVSRIEKKFEYYLDFPSEVRTMVINEMEPSDKCRFTRCSKSTRSEVKSLKDFLHTLELHSSYITSVYVDYDEDGNYGFKYHFIKTAVNSYMTYHNVDGHELWKADLCHTTSLLEVTVETFKRLLQAYQGQIREMTITGFEGRELENIDFGVYNFNRLEHLHIGTNVNLPQLLSQIRKPLKSFDSIANIATDLIYEQINPVQDILHVPFCDFSYPQLLNLSASRITCHIGELGIEDILNFIESWQNGEVRDNFRKCTWKLDGTSFDVNRLFQRLQVEINPDAMSKTNIRKHQESDEIAELLWENSGILKFKIMLI